VQHELLTLRLSAHVELSFAVSVSLLNTLKSEYDAVLLLSSDALQTFCSSKTVIHRLVPGAFVFFRSSDIELFQNHFSSSSLYYRPSMAADKLLATSSVSYLRKTSIQINTTAGTTKNNTVSAIDLTAERLRVESAVVYRSANERAAGSVLSSRSHKAAVMALQTQGLCIIPSYFPQQVITDGGTSAVQDVQNAVRRLESDPINMRLTPSPPDDADYSEYATRDTQFVRGHGDKYTLSRGSQMNTYAQSHGNDLRHNPHLLRVLEDVVLPPELIENETKKEKRKAQTMLRRSSSLLESHEVGAVVAMPGAGRTVDQTIHVDTEHLYEHVHLPPHYVVMFLPSLNTKEELEDSVGQTAFVTGSHVSSVARNITKDGKMEAHRIRWELDGIVRPHCRAGDVVLFDARILHFGIANASADVFRPLLFVNYTRPWFSDFQPGGEIIVRHR